MPLTYTRSVRANAYKYPAARMLEASHFAGNARRCSDIVWRGLLPFCNKDHELARVRYSP